MDGRVLEKSGGVVRFVYRLLLVESNQMAVLDRWPPPLQSELSMKGAGARFRVAFVLIKV